MENSPENGVVKLYLWLNDVTQVVDCLRNIEGG